MFDFVSLWKILSIISTGCFGVLGLLKDFKDKDTHRITPYGYVSLLGIVASAALGVISQTIEQSNSETEKVASAKQTLAIVQATQQSVQQIKRVISKIGRPTVDIDFNYRCAPPDETCRNFAHAENAGSIETMRPGIKGQLAVTAYRIDFFTRMDRLREALEYRSYKPDLTLSISINTKKSPNYRLNNDVSYSSRDAGSIGISSLSRVVEVVESNGRIVGIEDLRDSGFMITGIPDGFKIDSIGITTEGEIRSKLNIAECKYQTMKTFAAEQPTIFNHLGAYAASCRILHEAENE